MYPQIIRLVIISACIMAGVAAAIQDNAIREDFNSLNSWRPITFPAVKIQTAYTVEKVGYTGALKAVSNNSSSGLLYEKTFNVYRYPLLRWRWRIMGVYSKGNAGTRIGDDFPLRIYALFKYDPERASFGERLFYNTLKIIYGEYPPHSALCYVWGNRERREDSVASPYTRRVRMLMVQKGAGNIGRWIAEEADMLADYRRLFGKDPPPVAGLGIMSDSDNTGQGTTAYLDYIIISGRGR